ncbi:hypothetical protein AGMMS50212_06470 [Spirochaetia bacterium]|nr:hypothetical protein AGMMS50212_06470 [Spirochaetia bacterium]
MRKLKFVLLLAFAGHSVFAANVDTVNIRSDVMNIDVDTVVITPEKSSEGSAVIYLLHGYASPSKSWIVIQPEIAKFSDDYNVIFVCPNGENSWYWDSPINPSSQYETFVSKELVSYIDTNYKTLAERKQRSITGFSMGGYGALWLAIRNQDVFGNAGSISGAIDIMNIPKGFPIDVSPESDFAISESLGTKSKNKKLWKAHSLPNVFKAETTKPDLSLIIDCGYEDELVFADNEKFHKLLQRIKVPHTYIVRPGGHTVPYWNEAIDYQVLFFVKTMKAARG